MVAVSVHQMVGTPPELLPQLIYNLLHIALREVRHTQDDALPAQRMKYEILKSASNKIKNFRELWLILVPLYLAERCVRPWPGRAKLTVR